MSDLPQIYFYLPQEHWLNDMPDEPDVYWKEWGKGIYCWTLQTYLYLKADGFPCSIVGTMPEEGMVIAHRDSFPYEQRPTSKVLMVCIKPDRNPHPYAQLHVVQNPQDVKNLNNSYYIPLWRQPGLIPRNAERGDRFENIGYFGISYNLAPELKDPSWSKQLEELGFNWQILPKPRWYDYNDIDAVLAVRNFQQQDYTQKPATKLYNAWHAGVPAILGCESAFQAERKSELDYLEVATVEEAISALKNLRDDLELRQAMMKNAEVRAQETQPENIVKRWRNFFEVMAIPAYQSWRGSSSLSQQLYLQRCQLAIKIDAAKIRWRSLLSSSS